MAGLDHRFNKGTGYEEVFTGKTGGDVFEGQAKLLYGKVASLVKGNERTALLYVVL